MLKAYFSVINTLRHIYNKSYYALGLQVYNTNSIVLYTKMNLLIAKSRSKIECVNMH
jgi:hypothetical protein